MEFHVITLFPAMFAPWPGMVERAHAAGLIRIEAHPLRAHGLGAYRQVDDTPYGGGSGMVLRPEPLFAAVETVSAAHPGLWRVMLTPDGEPLNQSIVRGLAERRPGLLMIAGRYEGIDDRVRTIADQELSIGDYVLSGGELAAMVIIEAVARLIPGVLGNPESLNEESFSQGLLEYPHFTRPEDFRGMRVPEVLLSGDHQKIRAWREAESRARTANRRPDLLPAAKPRPKP